MLASPIAWNSRIWYQFVVSISLKEVVVHFNRGKVYIRQVMTHKEYDKGAWQGDC